MKYYSHLLVTYSMYEVWRIYVCTCVIYYNRYNVNDISNVNDDTDLSKDIYLNVPTLVEDIACVLSKEREIPKSESLTSPFELIKTFPINQK